MEHLPTDIRCEVCGEGFADRPAVVCRDCGTLHHGDCWQYNGGCSVYGCRCKRSEDWTPAVARGCLSVTLTADTTTPAYVTALLLFLGALGFGNPALVSLVLACVAGVVVFGLLALVDHVLPAVVTVIPEASAVARQRALFGRVALTCRPDWLTPDSVTEIRLLQERHGPRRNERLVAELADGSTVVVYDRRRSLPSRRLPWTDLCNLAEGMAQATDSSVRLGTGGHRGLPVDAPATVRALPTTSEPSEDGKKPSVHGYEPPLCPVCRRVLRAPVLQCQRCRQAVHEACWSPSKGCPIEGCGGRTADTPRPPTPENLPISCETPIVLYDVGLVVSSVLMCVAFLAGPAHGGDGLFLGFFTAGLLVLLAAKSTLGYGFFRWRYTFDPGQGTIRRTLRANWLDLWTNRTWGRLTDVVDVHQHWYTRWGDRLEELYVCEQDGRRTLIFSQSSADEDVQPGHLTGRDVDRLADHVAGMTDATVRFVRSREAVPERIKTT